MISMPPTTSELARRLAFLVLSGVTASSVVTGCDGTSAIPVSTGHHHTAQEGRTMYRSDLRTIPPQPAAGQPATLRFTVRDGSGRSVSDLTISHEQPMHLMIVSTDLHHFAHVHPVAEGESFRLEHTFEEGGEYFVVVDYQQPGRGQVVDRHRVQVTGEARARPPISESPRTQRADGLELTLESDGELRAGAGVMLHFTATDPATRAPVTDLEPYLGARAHFMVLSADGEDFVHVHALEGDSASRVSAHAVFPRPGLYKLWAQMQRRGAVATVPFVLRVDAAGEADPSAAPHSTGAHEHHEH